MNVREELKAYYDNELTPAQAEEVRRALESDPSALQEYEEIARVSQVMRTEAVQPQPYGLEDTLEALTVGRRKLSPVQERARKLGLILMGCAGVIVICAILFPTFSQAKSAAKNPGSMVAFKDTFANRAGESAAADGVAMNTPSPMDAINGVRSSAKAVRGGVGGFMPRSQTMMPVPSQENARRARGVDLSADTPASPTAVVPSAPVSNQLVVKNANLQVEVDSANAAQAKVEALVSSVRGMIESSNRVDMGGPIQVSMTIRVPVWSFETCLGSIRKLGKVLGDSVSGQDVTSQVVDTDARLKVLRSEEDQYRTLMSRARTIGEVMTVREKLTEVREEIESLDAQQKSMRGMAKMSTIALTLQERTKPVAPNKPQPPKTWSQNAWQGATDSLKGLWENLATIGIYLLVFSPIWLPLGLIGWMVYRRRL